MACEWLAISAFSFQVICLRCGLAWIVRQCVVGLDVLDGVGCWCENCIEVNWCRRIWSSRYLVKLKGYKQLMKMEVMDCKGQGTSSERWNCFVDFFLRFFSSFMDWYAWIFIWHVEECFRTKFWKWREILLGYYSFLFIFLYLLPNKITNPLK